MHMPEEYTTAPISACPINTLAREERKEKSTPLGVMMGPSTPRSSPKALGKYYPYFSVLGHELAPWLCSLASNHVVE